MSTSGTPGNRLHKTLARFVLGFFALLLLGQVLIGVFSVSGFLVFIFSGFLTILGLFFSFLQAFPNMQDGILKALPRPSVRQLVFLLVLALVVSTALNAIQFLKPTSTVPDTPNPLPSAQKSTPVPTVSETLASPIGTFHDDFNTPTLDSTLWQIDATNGALITIQGNRLVSSAPKNARAQGIMSSVNLYSIVNERASIQVVQIASGNSVDTAFGMQNSDGSNAIQVYVSKGHTIIVSTYQGPQVCHTTYSASTQQWWSIRESEGTTYVDVSPDGKTWETLCSHTDFFDMTHVRVFTTVDEWDADPSAGSAIFDNFVTT